MALHTPGHASDHLCFLLEEERGPCSPPTWSWGWSTSIIAPPDGNLNQYMDSLERLLELGQDGGIDRPSPRPRRVHQTSARPDSGESAATASNGPTRPSKPSPPASPPFPRWSNASTPTSIPKLHGPAAFSLRAHLDALVEEGKVVEDRPGRYEPAV